MGVNSVFSSLVLVDEFDVVIGDGVTLSEVLFVGAVLFCLFLVEFSLFLA